jgi:ABC-type glutathione transport system ATPase component
MTDAKLVSLTDVSVVYESGPPWARVESTALRSVSLGIGEGETLGLVGESGSGKTTIGRVMLGLLRPAAGSAELLGEPLAKARRSARGRIQVVLQHPEWSLNPMLRVGRSIAEPLAITHDVSRKEREAKVGAMLEEVGLEPVLARRYPHQLSGGQLQRASIARALITNPRLVVFDEAVSALDVSAQAQILNLIRKTQREYGYAALFISHQIDAVRYVSDRVAVLYGGEVVAEAPAAAFYGQPAHPYARALRTGGEGWPLSGAPAADVSVNQDCCPFASACPLAIERCRHERPLLRPVGEELAACHRAEHAPAHAEQPTR